MYGCVTPKSCMIKNQVSQDGERKPYANDKVYGGAKRWTEHVVGFKCLPLLVPET